MVVGMAVAAAAAAWRSPVAPGAVAPACVACSTAAALVDADPATDLGAVVCTCPASAARSRRV